MRSSLSIKVTIWGHHWGMIWHSDHDSACFFLFQVKLMTSVVRGSVLVCFVAFVTGCALVRPEPYDTSHAFGSAELREDFLLLRNALEEAHAGLYRYTAKEEFDVYFDKVLNRLEHEMTEIEFYRLVSRMIVKIRCTHSFIYPSQEYRQYQTNLTNVLPFDVKSVDGVIYVYRSYRKDSPLQPGMEIVAIDEIPIQELVKALLAYIPSDGYNQTGKYRRLEEAFPEYYYELIDQSETFSIVGRSVGCQGEQTYEVPALRMKSLRTHRKRHEQAHNKSQTPDFYIFEDSQTAVLTIPSFLDSDMQTSFKEFLQKTFKHIQDYDIRHLIIDVRGNLGGEDLNGSLLFSYLTDTPFHYYQAVEASTNHLSFQKHTNLSQAEHHVLQDVLEQEDTGKYVYRTHPNLREQLPALYPYDGKVYILIDGLSLSATAEFCAIAHSSARALFIGEETGGGYEGTIAGIGTWLPLPNTKIQIWFPLLKYVMAVSDAPQLGRGIIPDYWVESSIEDILAGVDRVMIFTSGLIEEFAEER